MRFTKLGLRRSIAFLKNKWVERGWLVTLTGFVIVAKLVLGATFDSAVEGDFKLDLVKAAF